MGIESIHRPEEGAMRRLLEENPDNAAGAVLRLAWLQGLLREEITTLTWAQVSFLDRKILLPGRESPMEEEMESYLREMYVKWGFRSEYVVFSQRFGKPMRPQAISRLARRTLDGAGQRSVRLLDLRHDYVIRQLQVHPAAYVAQVTGMEVRTLQLHFASYVEGDRRPSLRESRKPGPVDEFRLWKILQAERGTAAGLALWMTWQMGLTGGELVSLTWDRVDLEAGVVRLGDREAPISSTVRQLLEERRARRGEDPHVLVSDGAGRPLDLSRLSRLVRAALIRGGMDQVTLVDLYRGGSRSAAEAKLLERIRTRGPISRGDAMEVLGVTAPAAYRVLRRMADGQRLVRVGSKYYLPGTVVPQSEQAEVIRGYLERTGFAYRQDLAELLCVGSKQCGVILRHMVESGELTQERQKYYLNRKAEAR